MTGSRTLRIAIDCRLVAPAQGLGRAALSLANALSSSTIRDQEYTFFVQEGGSEWLRPHVFGPSRMEIVPAPRIKARLRALTPLRAVWRRLQARKEIPVPKSNGFFESRKFDAVHFPMQLDRLTSVPSIYQPWDLQHFHYPEFFSKVGSELRNKFHRAFCQQATFVCVQSNWGKADLVDKLGVPPEKVVVIPWGSVFEAYQPVSDEAANAVARKFSLPKQFFFYPAVTFPHKNHETVIRALEILKRERGRSVDVYFSGTSTDFRGQLEKLALGLQMAGQVHYLGFVETDELQALYRKATAMVFASKFEGFGLPIFESFHARLPVISSNATVLPEVAQDGALYFDPGSPAQLAEHMNAVLTDEKLRGSLAEKGANVLSRYSMADTAAGFQGLYERVARQSARGRGRPPHR